MTILSGTAFIGIPDQQANTGQPMTYRHMQNIAKDHGYVYEGLTGKKSDLSGAAGVVTAHSHAETGNKLFWPIMTQHFGSGHQGESDSTGATSGATSQNLEPCSISSTAATAEEIISWYFPVYVHPAWVNKKLTMAVQTTIGSSPPPNMRASLETWGTPDATVAAPQRAYTVATLVVRDATFKRMRESTTSTKMGAFSDDNCWVASLTPTSSGLQAVRINIRTGNTAVPFCGFESMLLTPTASVVNRNLPTKPAAPADGVNIATVGDADGVVANDYLPIDDSLVSANDPLGAASMISAFDSAYLEELATGLPASGNASMTLAKGHDHSQPAAAPWYGSTIQQVLTCKPLGTISTNAAIGGARAKAPKIGAAVITFQKFEREWIYTPVFSGAPNIYCAAIVRHNPGKASAIEVKFTSTPEGGGATSVTLTSSIAAGGAIRYELLTDTTNVLTCKSGGRTLFEVSTRKSAAGDDDEQILGYCVWIG